MRKGNRKSTKEREEQGESEKGRVWAVSTRCLLSALDSLSLSFVQKYPERACIAGLVRRLPALRSATSGRQYQWKTHFLSKKKPERTKARTTKTKRRMGTGGIETRAAKIQTVVE